MAYAYVNAGRDRDIARVLPCLLDEGHESDDPLFDLLDLIRMAGLNYESRALTFAAIKQSKHAQLMPWAVDELMEFAVFFLYQPRGSAGEWRFDGCGALNDADRLRTGAPRDR